MHVVVYLFVIFNRYPHTLFRFPLRHKGYKSFISDDDYTANSVLDRLFKNFKNEGEYCLLFLKKVEKIRYLYR